MIVCPRCGTENGKRVSNPVKCTRCWWRFDRAEQTAAIGSKEVGRADIRGAGKNAVDGAGGKRNDAAVPVLQSAEGGEVGLHSVQQVWGKLAARRKRPS